MGNFFNVAPFSQVRYLNNNCITSTLMLLHCYPSSSTTPTAAILHLPLLLLLPFRMIIESNHFGYLAPERAAEANGTYVVWGHTHGCTHTRSHTHEHTWSYAHYLHKLMPVLYWFARIGQHGCPVLPPWTFSFAAHTTHPYNLVMTNTDTRQRGWRQGQGRQRARERTVWVRRGGGERERGRGCNKAGGERGRQVL